MNSGRIKIFYKESLVFSRFGKKYYLDEVLELSSDSEL